jgi:hypothetical protein
MWHLETYKLNSKQKKSIIDLLKQAKEKIFQQTNMQVLFTNKQHFLPLNQCIELKSVSFTQTYSFTLAHCSPNNDYID